MSPDTERPPRRTRRGGPSGRHRSSSVPARSSGWRREHGYDRPPRHHDPRRLRLRRVHARRTKSPPSAGPKPLRQPPSSVAPYHCLEERDLRVDLLPERPLEKGRPPHQRRRRATVVLFTHSPRRLPPGPRADEQDRPRRRVRGPDPELPARPAPATRPIAATCRTCTTASRWTAPTPSAGPIAPGLRIDISSVIDAKAEMPSAVTRASAPGCASTTAWTTSSIRCGRGAGRARPPPAAPPRASASTRATATRSRTCS